MKKFNTLSRKLTSYSALAAAFIAGKSADAQIVYTDVDSDAIIHAGNKSANWYYIDLNNDQKVDIAISDQKDYYGNYFIINENLYGAKIAMIRTSYPVAVAFYYGDPIGSQLRPPVRWKPFGYVQWGGFGYFAGQGDRYLAIQMRAKDYNYTYGWIRLTVEGNSERFKVKDYAFNNQLNQPILAGRTSPCADGFENNNSFLRAKEIKSGLIYHPLINPAGDLDYFKFNAQQPNLRIRLFDLPANYDLKLYDSSSQLVSGSSNPGIENDTIIYNNIPSGGYYIEVLGKNNKFDSANCYSLKVETSAAPFTSLTEKSSITESKSVRIFPNPSAGNITIEYAGNSGNIQFIIYDATGKIVFNKSQEVKNSYRFDLNNLHSGIYLIEAKNGNDITQAKFAIEK
jgi:Secretion system C-terminal sorting domain